MLSFFQKYLKENEMLPKIEEEQLFKKYSSNQIDLHILADKLFRHNIRLIYSIAKKELKNNNLIDSPDAYIYSGYAGIIKAIEKYDLKKGTIFSTYASFWISKMILDQINEENYEFARIPTATINRINIYKKTINCLMNEKKVLNKKNILKELKKKGRYFQWKEHHIDDIEVVLNYRHANNTNNQLSKNDFEIRDLSNIFEQKKIKDKILLDTIMDNTDLSKKEAIIIQKRYLESDEIVSLEKIGKDFNNKRQAIYQLEQKALKKFRKTLNKLLSSELKVIYT